MMRRMHVSNRRLKIGIAGGLGASLIGVFLLVRSGLEEMYYFIFSVYLIAFGLYIAAQASSELHRHNPDR